MLSKKIILINGDAVLSSLMAQYLKARGFSVIRMKDAGKLQSTLHNLAADLVICDLLAPCTTKLSLAQCGVGEGPFSLPLIITSKMDSEKARAKAFYLGAHSYLPLPMDMDELYRHIQALLQPTKEQFEEITQKPISLC